MDFIPYKTKREIAKIYLADIVMVENELRIVIVHTEQREFRFYGKIDELVGFLDERFCRCHSGCIINLDKVVSMKDNVVYMRDGRRVILGKSAYQIARRCFSSYLNENSKQAKSV